LQRTAKLRMLGGLERAVCWTGTVTWVAPQYLTQRRQEIDRIYDDHYSILPLVLTKLLSGGRLVEDELSGLGEDKPGWIQCCSSISLNGDPATF
jgi:hypothetical protein